MLQFYSRCHTSQRQEYKNPQNPEEFLNKDLSDLRVEEHLLRPCTGSSCLLLLAQYVYKDYLFLHYGSPTYFY